MSKSGKFGYAIGRIGGFVLIYGLYLIGVISLIIDVRNLTMPVVPVILFLVISTWRRIVQIQTIMNVNAQIGEIRNLLLSDIATNHDADIIMSKINSRKFGGMN